MFRRLRNSQPRKTQKSKSNRIVAKTAKGSWTMESGVTIASDVEFYAVYAFFAATRLLDRNCDRVRRDELHA